MKIKIGNRPQRDGLELNEIKPMCGTCTGGHKVVWFIEPPPECPYCNAPITYGGKVCAELPLSFLSS